MFSSRTLANVIAFVRCRFRHADHFYVSDTISCVVTEQSNLIIDGIVLIEATAATALRAPASRFGEFGRALPRLSGQAPFLLSLLFVTFYKAEETSMLYLFRATNEKRNVAIKS